MAQVLQTLSADLAATVETAGKSIVRVEARRRQSASGIVWSAEGVIITAHHVVERDDNIQIGLPDGSTVNASLIGRDPSTDIALLRAETSGLTPAAWAQADAMKVGHLVLAVARPGKSLQATLGVISAVGEAWRTGAGGEIDAYVQTDVVMYPGFSGGPLVGADGVMLGLNSSMMMRDASITLPPATLTRVAQMLLTHGRVRRGFLGVSAQPARLPASVAGSAGQEMGLLLVAVEPDSPAEQGGLTLGDTLITLDGQPVQQMDDLMALLTGDRVGKQVPVRLVRGGQLQEFQVTIGERQ